jgi:deoxyadenosine/deoxycytidine kinase
MTTKWNWNYSIVTQSEQDHAEKLLVEISRVIPSFSDRPDMKIVLLQSLKDTAQRLIEREENTI